MTEQAEPDKIALQTIAETTGQFANNFLKVVACNDNPRNLITSPLSAQVVLAMAAYGAGGKTATAMRSALFIPSNDELGQSGYQSLIESLNAVSGVELRLANKIYTASNFEIKPAFRELTSQKFFSSIQEVDFKHSLSAAKTINNWCEEQTNNRIKDVIKPENLDPCTLLMLINAVYFKGQWEKKFDPSLTEDRPFHIDEKTTKNVPTMFIRKQFRCGEISELNAMFVEIPYEGQDLSMIIILPNEVNGLKTVQDNLHQVDLSQYLQRIPKDVELHLPKFKIESTLDLKEILCKLGMTDMFQNRADFSGIADISLKVSQVIQKAFIEVNEEGSEAAAVTRAVARFQCLTIGPPIRFMVDHPAIFAIRRSGTNTMLFVGHLIDPCSH